MKTKNNVQKTILSTSAVIITLLLLSYTVTARDFWKMVIENSSFNQIALAMADTRGKAKPEPANSETWAEKTVAATEPESELKVENWMKEKVSFDKEILLSESANEQPLEVEDWMLETNQFSNSEITEEPLAVEPWMVSENSQTR